MPRKDVDILPGQTFHLPAAQAKNFGNLLKIFGKKEATEAITEMAKTKSSTWSDIKDTVVDLKSFTAIGGVGAIVGRVQESISLTLEDALSPLSNEVNQLITDWMTTNITPILNDIISRLSGFVSDNSTGSLIGGIVGEILTLFLPGGQLLVSLASLIGAGIESLFKGIGGFIKDVQESWEQVLGGAKKDREQAIKDAQEFRDNFVRNRRLGEETLDAIKKVERIINENFAEEQAERRAIVEEERIQRRLGTQVIF